MNAQQPAQRRFLTLEDVAEILNVKIPLVRELVRSGALRGLQLGGRSFWRVGVEDLEDYIARKYAATAADVAVGRLVDDAARPRTAVEQP